MTTLVLIACLMYRTFGPVWSAMNTTAIGFSSDAIKNYYTVMFHLKYDPEMSWFTGMNYPYGEHVVFTDGQPTLANLLFLLRDIFPISDYVVGITNGFLLLSIFAGGLLMFSALTRLGVRNWVAALAAGVMPFLAPPIQHSFGHFGLAYIWIIPALLLLLDRFLIRRNWQSVGLLVCFGACIAGLHMYNLLFYLGMVLVSTIIMIVAEQQRRNVALWIKTIVAIIGPYVIFMLWFTATDPVEDRPNAPYGFLFSKADWEGVFLPVRTMIGHWITVNITPIRPIKDNYFIGSFPTLCTFGAVVITFYRLVRGRFERILKLTPNSNLNYMIWASVALLLFSLGIPFVFGLESWVEHLGPLKQFRALARFSWPFFFTVMLASFYWLDRWIRQWKWIALQFIVVLAIVGFEFNESKYYAKGETAPLCLLDRSWTEPLLSEINTNKYQAIIPIPDFQVGSENFNVGGIGHELYDAMTLSYQTGLPMLSTHLSRTSYSQSLKHMEFFGKALDSLRIIADIRQDAPLLLLVDTGRVNRHGQREILSKAHFVAGQGDRQLYEVSVDALRQRPAINKEMVLTETASLQFNADGFAFPHSLKTFKILCGDSAVHGRMGDSLYLLKDHVFRHSGDHVLSGWFNIAQDQMPRLRILHMRRTFNNAFESWDDYAVGDRIKAIQGNWALVEFDFNTRKDSTIASIVLFSYRDPEPPRAFKRLVIYPKGARFYRKGDGFIMKNNYYYPTQ